MTRTYDRGEKVRLKVSREGSAWMETNVLLDLGGETLIVGRSPKKARRVARKNVQDATPGTRSTKKTRRASRRPLPDPRSLYCSESESGLCATQRQAEPPKRAEMAGGVYSMCGTWLTSRAAPQKHEPTCDSCRTILGLEAT